MGKKNLGKNKVQRLIFDILGDIIGAFIFGIGMICFVGPANIAPGGSSSIALMINYLTDLPVGMMNLLINIPLLILAWFYLGKQYVFKTIRTVLIISVMMDAVVTPLIPIYAGDRLLGSLYGGVLAGAGMGLILSHGSTTGGTDIISIVLQKKFPSFSVGGIMRMIDGLVIASSMLVYHDVESGLFAIICLFTTSKVIDTILYGSDEASMVTIVSDKNREIAQRIINEMDRGATFLKGEGAYSGEDKDVLICAVRKVQFAKLKSIVLQEDRKAFIIVSEATEITGMGFSREHHKRDDGEKIEK